MNSQLAQITHLASTGDKDAEGIKKTAAVAVRLRPRHAFDRVTFAMRALPLRRVVCGTRARHKTRAREKNQPVPWPPRKCTC